MDTGSQLPALDELLRQRLRERREMRGLTRDQLAQMLRELGFETDHDRIAAIERGRVKLGLAELIGFAKVLRLDWDALVGHAEEWVAITPLWHMDGDQAGAVARLEPRALDACRTPREMAPGAQGQQLRTAITRQADADVARVLSERLGRVVSPEDVAAASLRLWGRSYTEERDARAVDRLPDDGRITPRGMQALRAHASRGLAGELFEEMGGG